MFNFSSEAFICTEHWVTTKHQYHAHQESFRHVFIYFSWKGSSVCLCQVQVNTCQIYPIWYLLMKKSSEDASWYQSLRIVCYSMCTLRFSPGRTVNCLGIDFFFFFFGDIESQLYYCVRHQILISLCRGKNAVPYIYCHFVNTQKKRSYSDVNIVCFDIFCFIWMFNVLEAFGSWWTQVQLG